MDALDPAKKDDGLRIRPFEEAATWVQANNEKVRAAIGIPTKAEVETSDSRVPTLMCTPFLEAEEFLERTQSAQAIIVVAFATGAMPDRLVPAMQQRLQEGVPIFVLSDNAGNDHGILKITYAAGIGAYKAGAIPLEKANVNNHQEVKAAILEALDQGIKGQELTRTIKEKFSYQKGETRPVAQWDNPDYVAPPRKNIREILFEGGFIDQDGKYTPPPEEFQPPKS